MGEPAPLLPSCLFLRVGVLQAPLPGQTLQAKKTLS